MSKEKQSDHGIPFAMHRPTKKMVSATDVQRGLACECICVACQSPLIARKGEIRIAHFAHHRDTDCPSAAEAAIHWMAKQVIAETGHIFVPHRSQSRTVFGKRRVWVETLSVVVQEGGLINIENCEVEKTIYGSTDGSLTRRPDLVANMNGRSLAIEICNTHAVDLQKEKWLEQHGYCVLEIDVSDLASIQPDEFKKTLEERLFENSTFSKWLVHLDDGRAEDFLTDLEHELRIKKQPEEEQLLSVLEAKEAGTREAEARRQKMRDVEDHKVKFSWCTVRLARNSIRATLKVHGKAHDFLLRNISILAKHYGGKFNGKYNQWEFYRFDKTKSLFDALRSNLGELSRPDLHQLLSQPVASVNKARQKISVPTVSTLSLPRHFSDPNLQELFDERAGMLEYDSGLKREEAENQAYDYVIGLKNLGSDKRPESFL